MLPSVSKRIVMSANHWSRSS